MYCFYPLSLRDIVVRALSKSRKTQLPRWQEAEPACAEGTVVFGERFLAVPLTEAIPFSEKSSHFLWTGEEVGEHLPPETVKELL